MTDLDQIRERTDADFTAEPATVTGPLAKELMQARLDRRVLLAEVDRLTSDYRHEPEGA